jgi:hypothetical protein
VIKDAQNTTNMVFGSAEHRVWCLCQAVSLVNRESEGLKYICFFRYSKVLKVCSKGALRVMHDTCNGINECS